MRIVPICRASEHVIKTSGTETFTARVQINGFSDERVSALLQDDLPSGTSAEKMSCFDDYV